jgi:hypothetical protein
LFVLIAVGRASGSVTAKDSATKTALFSQTAVSSYNDLTDLTVEKPVFRQPTKISQNF